MPADVFDQILDELEDDVESFRLEAEEIIKERLRSLYPPSSKPGEHPHYRTGRLHDSVRCDVERFGDQIRFNVRVTAPYSVYLEPDRPIISDLLPTLAQMAIDRVMQRLADG